jgi:hypothetical protein
VLLGLEDLAEAALGDYSRMTVTARMPVAIFEGLLIVRARPR